MTAWALGALGTGLSRNFASLVVARMIVGAGSLPSLSPSPSLLFLGHFSSGCARARACVCASHMHVFACACACALDGMWHSQAKVRITVPFMNEN